MKKINIGVIGLGYVGLPVAVLLSKKYKVTGFDINSNRVVALNNYQDKTLEVTNESLEKALQADLTITDKEADLKSCNFFIVTVPTPILQSKKPNLQPLEKASKMVGRLLKIGDIVVYESTVYPGCTEEVCVPILEVTSKLVFNKDFFCGYSPERINPGDKEHTVDKIKKVTSGSTAKTAEIVDSVYASVIEAGTHKASSIKVAEAAKVIENAQRDINIAFINELAMIFSRLGIDTTEVLNAAATKWNFLHFKPGLVGGHCIGVDPYYLASKALAEGFNPEIILAGRKVNDRMGFFVAEQVISKLEVLGKDLKASSVLVLGATFKENCPDYRNTKVIDLIEGIQAKGLEVVVHDPWVDAKLFKQEYNIDIKQDLSKIKFDAIILAVSHQEFRRLDLNSLKKDNDTVIYDIKSFYEKKNISARL